MKELLWGKSTIHLHGGNAERPHYGPLTFIKVMFLHSLRQIEDTGKELDTRLARPI
jgi:hypothetical protein